MFSFNDRQEKLIICPKITQTDKSIYIISLTQLERGEPEHTHTHKYKKIYKTADKQKMKNSQLEIE